MLQKYYQLVKHVYNMEDQNNYTIMMIKKLCVWLW